MVPLLGAASGSTNQSFVSDSVRGTLHSLGLDSSLGTLIIVLVGGMLLKSVISLYVMRKVGYANAEVANLMRVRLIKQMLGARWSYLLEHPTGRIANAFSGEVGRSQQAYQLAAQFVAEAVQTFVMLLLGLMVSWKLALASIAIGAITGGAVHFLVNRAKKAGRAQTELTKELVSLLTDTLDNLKPLKAMGAQQEFVEFFDRRLHRLRRALRRQVINKEAMRNGQDALFAVCMGVSAYLAIVVLQTSLEQVIVIGVILSANGQGLRPAADLFAAGGHRRIPVPGGRDADRRDGGKSGGCGRQRAAAFRARDPLRDGAILLWQAPGAQRYQPDHPDRQHHRAHRAVGCRQDHADRSRSRPAPAAVGPDPGRWRRPRADRAAGLAHDGGLRAAGADPVPCQHPGEPDPQRRGPWRGAVEEALRLAGADEFVANLPEGVHTVVGSKGARLSGGQRQRIALARALIRRPRLLILDEVTSALDPESEQEICRNIMDLRDRTTVLAVTHRPAFLEIATRVYQIEDGSAAAVAGGLTVAAPA